ncbi:NAD(P)/FAD-dependent oxidoreductase [Gellertiella hungarica]|uniref:D-arginine dehydrogenase n=1 Tax=Gellertiella hungarica TaxID=1572859 RepID=A0A7W6J6H2_9HYPH|nr:FAD-binding oxidoreductase [Gellertiella hungarica]MBB4065681.1 D-arginine dehydrogenase [Gellertiella hungarica]
MDRVDVAIIGGGIAGASLAWFLGGQQSVAILEAEDQPGYHATARSAAEFVLNYNPPAVSALARAARPFFDNPPEGFAAVPLLVPRGGLVIAHEEDAALFERQVAELAPRVPGLAVLTRAEAVARMPILDPDSFAHAYFDPEYWDIEADALLQGYLRGARHRGVALRLKSGVLDLDRQGGLWRIETASGPLLAETVVNAAGGWADRVAMLGGVAPLGITPLRRTAILVDLPDGIDASRLPELNDIADAFYFKPDGGRLLVSPADETPCEPGDVQPEEIDIAWAVHHLESHSSLGVKRVAKAWAGMRTFSPDRLPVVGYDPQAPGFFWLAGQGGFGILTSPALGALAAALIRHHPVPAHLAAEGITEQTFSPARFGTARGA